MAGDLAVYPEFDRAGYPARHLESWPNLRISSLSGYGITQLTYMVIPYMAWVIFLASKLSKLQKLIFTWLNIYHFYQIWGIKRSINIRPLKTLSSFDFFSHVPCSFEWPFEFYPWSMFNTMIFFSFPFWNSVLFSLEFCASNLHVLQ